VKKAIRDHSRDFAAVIALFVFATAITLFILSQQRLSFPSWVPGLGENTFELKAEFSSAQAVTPGQGQTVNIAGIRVGDVSAVDLEDGRAVITMEVDDKYVDLIHPNATMLLRPKTGLQDMTIEVDPGTGHHTVPEGTTIPLAQTQPNVNTDQILASLDADTRDYLTLLLQGGAQGLGGRGKQLSAALRRFEPTGRDLARLSSAIAKRRANLRQVIHSFRLVSEQLGKSGTHLADFVTSSNQVLAAFARQEQSVRESFQELPSALRETNSALESSNRLSLALGPALQRPGPDLTSAAAALGPALRQAQPFFEQTTGPIRNQIRPFARSVQPTVADLTRASKSLGEASPPLASAFGHLNALLNALAYNPPGSAEEGYLFWTSWLNHTGNSIFLTQDGEGPLRRGIVMLSCTTARGAFFIANNQPFLRTVQQLTNVIQNPFPAATTPPCDTSP
jgi:phospholipid/cholesterol/gamma-HCH transport system substrate-binding protein